MVRHDNSLWVERAIASADAKNGPFKQVLQTVSRLAPVANHARATPVAISINGEWEIASATDHASGVITTMP
jgi:hypothetical protein